MPRKLPLIATALVALALPATAAGHGRYAAERIAKARVAAPAAEVAKQQQVPAECPNADLVPSAGNLDAFRAAVACLHNRIRAANGLPLLRTNAKLGRAANGHSADMVSAGYFEHTSPSGSTMVDRILGTGYVRRDRGWLLGENLEWGTGSLATPRGAVDAWMNSPSHRANVLKRGYRELGIGVALGTPAGGAEGVTITVDFGARR